MSNEYERMLLQQLEAEASSITATLEHQIKELTENPYVTGTAVTGAGVLAVTFGFATLPTAGAFGMITLTLGLAGLVGYISIKGALVVSEALGAKPLSGQQTASVNLAVDLVSNPFSLVLANIGATFDGMRGAALGSELGNLLEGTTGLALGARAAMRGEPGAIGEVTVAAGDLMQVDLSVLREWSPKNYQTPSFSSASSNAVEKKKSRAHAAAQQMQYEQVLELARKAQEESRKSEEAQRQAQMAADREKARADSEERLTRREMESKLRESEAEEKAKSRDKAEEAERAADAAAAQRAYEESLNAAQAAAWAKTTADSTGAANNDHALFDTGGGVENEEPSEEPPSIHPL